MDDRVDGLMKRVADLERRVAVLDNQQAPGAVATGDAEVDRLVVEGNMLGAIKRYRALTGVGLREAKDAVEGLRRI